MGDSYKKTPIVGMVGVNRSEKYDKRLANRRLRRAVNQQLDITPEDEDADLPIMREVSNVWSFSKDGKVYISEEKIERAPEHYAKILRK